MSEQLPGFNPNQLGQRFAALGAELATKQDAEELAALINEGFSYQDADRGRPRVTAEELRERINEDPFYVIKDSGKITATVTTYPDTASLLHFGLLVVAEQKRGQGLGEKLVRAVEETAEAQGYAGVSLGYFVAAPQLEAYYERLGYEIKGENYMWENLEVVNMVKLFQAKHEDAGSV